MSKPESPPPPPAPPIDRGIAGSSARREYERRVAKHEQRIEEKWGTGRIGKVATFLAEEPQSTTAWARSAEGEERLARTIDDGLGDTATALHDRRIPRTRANIDHLVGASSGLWVIDTKNYKGKAQRRDVGSWRTRDDRLYVRGRDQTKLVSALEWQAGVVRVAVDAGRFEQIPIYGCLCFSDAD